MRYLAASGIQVVAFAIAACIFGYAQAETPSAQLRIKLAKAEYFPGEAALVTYRITNLSKSLLLCFPPPAVDCFSISGELGTNATPPAGVTKPKINHGCASDRWVKEDAGDDIDQHWIKLAPLQFYEMTWESHYIGLSSPGVWTIEAGYVPMREDTRSLYADAMKERGCSNVPELHSQKVAIIVKSRR